MKYYSFLFFFVSASLFVFSFSLSKTDDLSKCVQEYAFEVDEQEDENNFQEAVLQVYFFKRLSLAAEILAMIQEKNLFPTICGKNPNCFVFDENLFFKSPEIEKCKLEIIQTKSLSSFFQLWDFVSTRESQLSSEYLREMALLILSIYRTIFTAYSPLIQIATQKNLILQAVTVLCGNLTDLHAFELLSIIERLSVQIPKLLAKYELSKSDLTWKQWFAKYWWLPPIAFSAAALELIMIYQVAVGARKLPRFKGMLNLFQNNIKNPKEIPSAIAT